MKLNCVITGAARGIGLSIAEQLLNIGAQVVLSDVDSGALDGAIKQLKIENAMGVAGDISITADVANLTAQAEKRFGPIDVWINNAGLARHHAIPDYTEADIDLMLAVNLKGTILGSQAALRAMSPHGSGQIINIISTASLRGIPTESVYCAAKWGVRGFTQALREEAAPLGIRVTALLPGGVDTAFWSSATPERQMPVQNFLTAKQVADAVIALVQMDKNIVPQELVIRALKDRDFGG